MDKEIASKLEEFFAQFKNYKYKKGEILIRSGDNPGSIYFIKSGRVKQYSISRNGDEFIVNIFKPMAFFPMSWAINNTKNEYFFEAMENLDVIKAPREKVIEFIKSEPEILYNLLSRVFSGMDGVLQRMTYFMSGNAYTRLVIELLIVAKRFGEKDGNSVIVRTSEKDIASQAGMTRETISREIKLLKDKSLLTFTRNEIVIPNIQKLEEELSLPF